MKAQTYEVLKASKAKMEKRYIAKIEELEKKLRAKDVQFEEGNIQRLGVETQLKGSNIQLGKVVEEVASLKVHLKGKDDDQIPLPQCNEFEKLIEQCQNLDGMVFRKDVVIQILVLRRDQEGTRKLFKESKRWSLKYFKNRGPLTYVERED